MPGENNKARLRVQWKEGDTTTLPLFFIDNGTLKLNANSWLAFVGQKNAYIVEVTLPQNCSININMFAGVVYLNDMRGDINVSVKAGEIRGTLFSKHIKALVWAGEIKLVIESLSADSIIYTACSLGDIKLWLPKEAYSHQKKYTRSQIPNKVDADIRARIWLGDVSIRAIS